MADSIDLKSIILGGAALANAGYTYTATLNIKERLALTDAKVEALDTTVTDLNRRLAELTVRFETVVNRLANLERTINPPLYPANYHQHQQQPIEQKPPQPVRKPTPVAPTQAVNFDAATSTASKNDR